MDLPWSDVINLFTGEWVAPIGVWFSSRWNSMFVLFRDMVVEGAISKRLAGLELPHQ
jgi:phosphatidylserine/phosphatidylglycerophosphate/cardiolipin synthase-like enzyme